MEWCEKGGGFKWTAASAYQRSEQFKSLTGVLSIPAHHVVLAGGSDGVSDSHRAAKRRKILKLVENVIKGDDLFLMSVHCNRSTFQDRQHTERAVHTTSEEQVTKRLAWEDADNTWTTLRNAQTKPQTIVTGSARSIEVDVTTQPQDMRRSLKARSKETGTKRYIRKQAPAKPAEDSTFADELRCSRLETPRYAIKPNHLASFETVEMSTTCHSVLGTAAQDSHIQDRGLDSNPAPSSGISKRRCRRTATRSIDQSQLLLPTLLKGTKSIHNVGYGKDDGDSHHETVFDVHKKLQKEKVHYRAHEVQAKDIADIHQSSPFVFHRRRHAAELSQISGPVHSTAHLSETMPTNDDGMMGDQAVRLSAVDDTSISRPGKIIISEQNENSVDVNTILDTTAAQHVNRLDSQPAVALPDTQALIAQAQEALLHSPLQESILEDTDLFLEITAAADNSTTAVPLDKLVDDMPGTQALMAAWTPWSNTGKGLAEKHVSIDASPTSNPSKTRKHTRRSESAAYSSLRVSMTGDKEDHADSINEPADLTPLLDRTASINDLSLSFWNAAESQHATQRNLDQFISNLRQDMLVGSQ